MQLNFVGKNIEVTPALKKFTEEKMQPLEKRFNKITSVHIVLLVEKEVQIAEATVHVYGIEIHATAKAKDMYEAIEELAKKLLGQITKHKEKLIESHH